MNWLVHDQMNMLCSRSRDRFWMDIRDDYAGSNVGWYNTVLGRTWLEKGTLLDNTIEFFVDDELIDMSYHMKILLLYGGEGSIISFKRVNMWGPHWFFLPDNVIFANNILIIRYRTNEEWIRVNDPIVSSPFSNHSIDLSPILTAQFVIRGPCHSKWLIAAGMLMAFAQCQLFRKNKKNN